MSQIHQEILLDAAPERVYAALTQAKEFSAMTAGAPAKIESQPGGEFSCFGGMITGRMLELLPNQRLVQAWRAGNWAEGCYSIVKFELKKEGSKTRLVFDHEGFPKEEQEHLETGWEANYWSPLKKYLS